MTIVVVDASALVEYLLGSELGAAASTTIESTDVDLHTPFLCDIEIASALRGLVAAAKVPIARALEAIEDYADLPMVRHGHLLLLERVLALRHNFSAYDATYVGLAEALEATFLTSDAALAKSIETHLPELDLLAVV